MKRKAALRMRRVRQEAEPEDGCRILVDRLWPRGLSKEKAHVDLWLKEVAPSTELRHWFDHSEARWPEFRRRYFEELKGSEEALATIRERRAEGPVTLLFDAREERFNNAVALAEYLEGKT